MRTSSLAPGLGVARIASIGAIGAVLVCPASAQTARFTAAEVTVRTALSDIDCVALDSAGNIYMAATQLNLVLKEVPRNGGYVESAVGDGLSRPTSVTVDAHGDVYIADSGNYRVLKETPNARGYTQSIVADGFQVPSGVAVDKSGNVFVADQTNNEVVEEVLSGTSYFPKPIRTGLNAPFGIAVDANGDLFIADAGNGRVLKEKPKPGGYTESKIGSGLAVPSGVGLDGKGNVYIADLGNARVVKETVSGAGYTQSTVPAASPLGQAGNLSVGPAGVAVDKAGNIYIATVLLAFHLGSALYKEFPSGANFGQVPVQKSGLAAKLAFTFQTGGKLGNTAVKTQGAPAGDFANAHTGSCKAGAAYAAGQTCAIELTFKPQFPGTRYGAASLIDRSGHVIATGYAHGTGQGPEISFLPGTQTTVHYSAGGQSAPFGVAVDDSGAVYIADTSNNRVLKETPASRSYVESTVDSGLNSPNGIAVDGSGNVYIADTHNSRVLKETPGPSGYAESTIGSGLDQPYGVAVDGNGNVYINDSGNKRVLKETLSAGSYMQSTIPTSGLATPFGIAIDGSGNVYVSDGQNRRVLKLTLSGGAYAQSTVDDSLNLPYGVAVDGFGNVFIADYSGEEVYRERPLATGYGGDVLPIAGVFNPVAVAVDKAGRVYIGDAGHDQVLLEDYADPPALTFNSTVVGATSSDSPKTITVENIGNAPLSFPVPKTGTNPSVAANFTLGESSGADCALLSASSAEPETVAAGDFCELSISFAPLAVGSLSGSVVLTDDMLNAAAPAWATQKIGLSGQGLQAPAAVQ